MASGKGKRKSKHRSRSKSKAKSKSKAHIYNSEYQVTEKVFCYFGTIIYEAFCKNVFQNSNGEIIYFIHYCNWDKTWSEWVYSSVLMKHVSSNYPLYEEYFKFYYGEFVFYKSEEILFQGKVIKLMHDTFNKCRYLIKLYDGDKSAKWLKHKHLMKINDENKKIFEKFFKFYRNDILFCLKNNIYRIVKCINSKKMNDKPHYEVEYLDYNLKEDKFEKFEWVPEYLLRKKEDFPGAYEMHKLIDDFEAKLILEQNLKNLKKAKKQKYTDESDNEYCILNSEAECDTEDEEEEEDEEMQKKFFFVPFVKGTKKFPRGVPSIPINNVEITSNGNEVKEGKGKENKYKKGNATKSDVSVRKSERLLAKSKKLATKVEDSSTKSKESLTNSKQTARKPRRAPRKSKEPLEKPKPKEPEAKPKRKPRKPKEPVEKPKPAPRKHKEPLAKSKELLPKSKKSLAKLAPKVNEFSYMNELTRAFNQSTSQFGQSSIGSSVAIFESFTASSSIYEPSRIFNGLSTEAYGIPGSYMELSYDYEYSRSFNGLSPATYESTESNGLIMDYPSSSIESSSDGYNNFTTVNGLSTAMYESSAVAGGFVSETSESGTFKKSLSPTNDSVSSIELLPAEPFIGFDEFQTNTYELSSNGLTVLNEVSATTNGPLPMSYEPSISTNGLYSTESYDFFQQSNGPLPAAYEQSSSSNGLYTNDLYNISQPFNGSYPTTETYGYFQQQNESAPMTYESSMATIQSTQEAYQLPGPSNGPSAPYQFSTPYNVSSQAAFQLPEQSNKSLPNINTLFKPSEGTNNMGLIQTDLKGPNNENVESNQLDPSVAYYRSAIDSFSSTDDQGGIFTK